MKITAQLALSQMKVNKKRTIAGIFGEYPKVCVNLQTDVR